MVGQSAAERRRLLLGDSPDGLVERVDEGGSRETGALVQHRQARYGVRVAISTDVPATDKAV